jgi:hypothetical protein
MSCERVRGHIVWYLYNELDEGARASLEDHVESCPACAAELDKERAFLARLSARPALEPSAALLAECRHDLMRAVYREERRRQQGAIVVFHPRTVLRQLWSWMGAARQPAAALALVAMGFFGGWYVRNGNGSRSVRVAAPTDAVVANISGVNLDPQAGQVQIAFDEVRRQTLTGRLQDPRIQNFLIFAAKSYANPGVRMDTIDILKERAGERQIRDTLLYVLSNDRNPGVRLKALEGLKQYAQDEEVRKALMQVLTADDNPGMRVQAIDLLMVQHDHGLIGVLQDVAAKEQNNYVRMRCESALRDMNASVETF